MFGPRITLFTKNGHSVTREGTGREFIWDFEEQVRRIKPITPGLAISPTQYDSLIDACRTLETVEGAGKILTSLTVPA